MSKGKKIKIPLLRYSIPIILGVIVNYWISHSADETGFIKYLNEKKATVDINIITALILLYIFCYVYSDISNYITKKMENRIEEIKGPLINENNELKSKLSTKAGSLIDTFSELQHFQEKEVLMKHLQEFTGNHEVVHSAQVYTYFKKIKEEKITIKVSYINGYAYENIDINAMIQTYYEMDLKIYQDIMKIMGIKNQIDSIKENINIDAIKVNNELLGKLEAEMKSTLMEFISNNREKINEKNIENLNDDDAILFALLELCIELLIDNDLEGEALDGLWKLQITDSIEKDIKLRSLKRTGILNGIFKINTHKFKNKGDSNKKDRIYITRCFKMNNLNCVMCLSLIPSMIEYCNLYDLLTQELMNNLNTDFQVWYNYSKSS